MLMCVMTLQDSQTYLTKEKARGKCSKNHMEGNGVPFI